MVDGIFTYNLTSWEDQGGLSWCRAVHHSRSVWRAEGRAEAPRANHLEQGSWGAPGSLPWGLQVHGGYSLSPGKVPRYSTVFYPALHQSQMKPVGSVWPSIQRESRAKPCSLCSPLRCDKWQGATAVLRDDRAVLCIQTAPRGLISSDKRKALRNVSCPLKIHQEISLGSNTI